MDTKGRRPSRARVFGLAATIALLAMLLPGAAGVASAHNYAATLTCVSGAPTLQVNLTSYAGSPWVNKVTVTIDGVVSSADSNANFGTTFQHSWTLSPATTPHTAVVAVVAGDNSTYSHTFNLSVGQCQKASPSIITLTGGSVVLGDGHKLTDTATLSGGYNPTGTITFTLSDPSGTLRDTETATVSGNGSYATPTGFLPNVAGTWHWVASYSGDAGNNKVASGASDEPVVVNPAGPSIATTLSATTGKVGATVHDSAALTGATANAGGSVTYSVYTNNICTAGIQDAGTKTVTNGAVPNSNAITFNSAGTWYWQAVYSGDANNKGAKSPCTSEILVVDATPSPSPSASSSPSKSPSPSPSASPTTTASATSSATSTVNPSQSIDGATATPTAFESVLGVTSGPNVTPPVTNTSSNPSGDRDAPLFALLLCLAFGSLAMLMVEKQRRAVRR